ncbi:MAG: Rid family detoxifying hydrolase [Pseudomonadota bacterium]
MTKKAVVSNKLAPPAGPFSAGVIAGDFIFVSGQIGQDPATGKLVEGGIERQTERIFLNLALVLEAAGKSFADVVRAGVYLTDMSQFAAMNAVYALHFDKPYPARTTIGVAALPLGAAVEIDLVVQA